MAWINELEALAARFGCGVASDMAAMNYAQLWAVCAVLGGALKGGA